MSGFGLQDAAALVVALAALAWLIRRRITGRHRPVACEGCPAAMPRDVRRRRSPGQARGADVVPMMPFGQPRPNGRVLPSVADQGEAPGAHR